VKRLPAAILGPGNIGTDLLLKLERSDRIEPVLAAGIYPDSEGLAIARDRGVATSDRGVDAVLDRDDIQLVFDLTPAATGPYVVPGVNLYEHLDSPDVNLISCGAQATIPLVHAIRRVVATPYAEIVATIASRSAGPGTRQNIDEFTRTTADGVVKVGGADTGKAIIVLNPADPPILMRDAVYARVTEYDRDKMLESIDGAIAEVQRYVPGYRPLLIDAQPEVVTVIVQVEGAGDYLPSYAGNLDIMTSAAVRVGEEFAARLALAETGAG
jgi:acetaldehyde dehydrogenase